MFWKPSVTRNFFTDFLYETSFDDICVLSYGCSYVLSYVCSHMCAPMCSQMCAFICVFSFVCSFYECSYLILYVCSYVLSYMCSHMCALICVLSCVCFHMYPHMCVFSYVCFHMSALLWMLLCAFICALSYVCSLMLSYTCSYDTVSFFQLHSPLFGVSCRDFFGVQLHIIPCSQTPWCDWTPPTMAFDQQQNVWCTSPVLLPNKQQNQSTSNSGPKLDRPPGFEWFALICRFCFV